MSGIVAKDGTLVTDDMIESWERSLDRDEWPEGWVNVGEIMEGRLPTFMSDSVTLSVKMPSAMKRALGAEAESEGKSTSAYVRALIAGSLMASA